MTLSQLVFDQEIVSPSLSAPRKLLHFRGLGRIHAGRRSRAAGGAASAPRRAHSIDGVGV